MVATARPRRGYDVKPVCDAERSADCLSLVKACVVSEVVGLQECRRGRAAAARTIPSRLHSETGVISRHLCAPNDISSEALFSYLVNLQILPQPSVSRIHIAFWRLVSHIG